MTRKLHKRKYQKQRRIIIITSLVLTFSLSIGYAAFQTNITLNTKGTIKTTSEKCFTVENNKDGTGTITDYDETCGSKVKIPSKINNLTITKIGDALLYENIYSKSFTKKNIELIILPDTLEEIGLAAFDNNKIKKLIIPDSVKKINNVAFRHNNISVLKLPNHYIEMGLSVFNDNSLKEEDAFIYKQNIDGSYDKSTIISYAGIKGNNITIPSTVKTLDAWSFRALYNNKFSSITIPDNVELIGTEALQWNTYLKNIDIGNGVKEIGSYAISHNQSLETVTIGSGINKINSYAFYNCPKLTKITINRKEGAVEGAPWGASNASINWVGTN